MVIRYSFLWGHEADKGNLEGVKDRPVMVVILVNNEQEVVVAPLTTKPPRDNSLGFEVPATVRKHLGLGNDRCWISVDTVNQFVWPGPDVRIILHSNQKTIPYGIIPQYLLDAVKAKIIQQLLARVPNFMIQRGDE